MTVHRITTPDAFAGDEPREIVWDSEAGTLAGDHSLIDGPWGLRALLDKAAADGYIGTIVGGCRLNDPWHDPGEFLVVCGHMPGLMLDPAALPEALRGVELPPPDIHDPGERVV